MKEALIQRKDDIRSYLDTVWVVDLIKGSLVLILCYLLAPIITSLTHSDNTILIIDVIRVVGLIYFIQCFTNSGVVYFEKNIEFSKYFLYQISGTVADVIATLIFVYYLQNVWALFYGVIAGNLVRVIFSFLMLDFRPKLKFDSQKAKELFRFGKWIFKSRIFTFLGMQLDSIIVSTFFSLRLLGIYQMAFRIGSLPITQVSNVMGRIIFPSLSRVHEDIQKVKEYFLITFNVLLVVAAPIVILVYCFIPGFTALFLGPQWSEIVPVTRILIVSGFVRIFASLLDYLFSAIGQPKLSAKLQSRRFIFFLLFIGPFSYWWDIKGVALTSLVALSIVFVIYMRIAYMQLRMNWNELYQLICLPFLFSVLIAVVTLFWIAPLYNGTILSFFVLTASTITLYIVIGILFTYYTDIKIFERTIALIKSSTV